MARRPSLVKKSEHEGTVWPPDQYMQICAAANRKGFKISEYCRRVVDAEIDKILKIYQEYVE